MNSGPGGSRDSTAGDGISSLGGFSNSGILEFLGGLHTLALSGNYSQGSGGTLKMRLANGTGGNGASDLLTVSGGATLAGTLDLDGMGSLNDNQSWRIIDAAFGYGATDFGSVNWPDGRAWARNAGARFYDVNK